MEIQDTLCLPIPKDAIKCNNYLDAYGDIVFRIVEMPDNTFIGQDKYSSLGFKSYKGAETYMFTFNQ